MSDELVFYTNPMSRGRIARWMLEEVGAPYRTEVLQYGPEMKAPEYLRLNPMGKVPVITHRGQVVSEAAAICAYLADAFPETDLAPAPGDPARACYYRWLFFTAGPFEAAVSDKALGVTVPAEKQGFIGYGSFDATIDTIEQALSGKDYLAGDTFSAADLYVGAQLGFQLQFGTLEARPAFVTYTTRLMQRPAYIRASEIDDALMPTQD